MSKTAFGVVALRQQAQAKMNAYMANMANEIFRKSMGTRARIGILNSDGSVRSIYVGSDGYLSWTGTRLLKHFNTPSKVRKLISMGGMLIIGEEIGEKHDADAATRTMKDPKWCQFYTRDRGEKDMGAVTSPTLGAFFTGEYHYLWKDKQWWLAQKSQSPPFTFTDLRVAVATDRLTD